jgi:Secretion system C-terminal sorting domain
MPNKDTILVCGHGLNDGSSQNFGFIAKSTNDGEVWSIQDFLSTSALRSIISLNDSVFFCVGYPFDPNPHAFLKSINGGYSWNYQDYETTCTECFAVDVRDVFCPSENVCYAISGEGLIYRTLNGGGELYPLANSVEEQLFASFDISPNPTTDHITIKSNLIIESIQITNCFGQSVQPRINLGSKSFTFDVSFLVSGLYYIYFETGTGTTVQRFLKQ